MTKEHVYNQRSPGESKSEVHDSGVLSHASQDSGKSAKEQVTDQAGHGGMLWDAPSDVGSLTNVGTKPNMTGGTSFSQRAELDLLPPKFAAGDPSTKKSFSTPSAEGADAERAPLPRETHPLKPASEQRATPPAPPQTKVDTPNQAHDQTGALVTPLSLPHTGSISGLVDAFGPSVYGPTSYISEEHRVRLTVQKGSLETSGFAGPVTLERTAEVVIIDDKYYLATLFIHCQPDGSTFDKPLLLDVPKGISDKDQDL